MSNKPKFRSYAQRVKENAIWLLDNPPARIIDIELPDGPHQYAIWTSAYGVYYTEEKVFEQFDSLTLKLVPHELLDALVSVRAAEQAAQQRE